MKKIKKYLQALGQLTDRQIEDERLDPGAWTDPNPCNIVDREDTFELDPYADQAYVDPYHDPDEKQASFEAAKSYSPLVLLIAPANTKPPIYWQNNNLTD